MKNYMVAKSNYKGEIVFINYDKLDGYKVLPKNYINYPGIKVNSLIIIKPSFIEKVLKKKVKRKLSYYLEYLINMTDDSDDSSDFRQALNDITRFKEIVEYKYRKYLDDRYINLLLKKVSVLEREIKSKLVFKKMKQEENTIEKEEKSHRSR